ncbi:MAG: hypothetical protein K2N69_02080 [Helicobacter sp.]|nr:hypothetical protein [Helicobacter sp.]
MSLRASVTSAAIDRVKHSGTFDCHAFRRTLAMTGVRIVWDSKQYLSPPA